MALAEASREQFITVKTEFMSADIKNAHPVREAQENLCVCARNLEAHFTVSQGESPEATSCFQQDVQIGVPNPMTQ